MPERLIGEIQALTRKISDLDEHVTVAQSQAKRTRRLGILSVILVALSLVLSGLAVVGGILVYRLTNDLSSTQEQSCLNANVTRAGQRAAWTELLNVSTASLKAQAEARGVEPSPVILAYYAAFTLWIQEGVFPDRDCDNLNAPAPAIPDPPSFEDAIKESIRQQQDD